MRAVRAAVSAHADGASSDDEAAEKRDAGGIARTPVLTAGGSGGAASVGASDNSSESDVVGRRAASDAARGWTRRRVCVQTMDIAAVLAEAMRKKSNRHCAECGLHGPKWVSVRLVGGGGVLVHVLILLYQINLGIFVCHRCSGAHRGLGVHISKVQSLLQRFVVGCGITLSERRCGRRTSIACTRGGFVVCAPSGTRAQIRTGRRACPLIGS